MTDAANPFDALDGTEIDGNILKPAPPPSLLDRFQVNREASYYSGTLGGAIQGAGPESYERERALARYESLPQWETPLEGLAALAGQIAPQVSPFSAPENFIPFGIGEKAVAWAGIRAGTRARLLAGAIDAGSANAATDPTIQGIEIAHGTRESYDPVQTAASIALGAGISAVGREAGHLIFGHEASAAIAEAAPPKLSITPETFIGENVPAVKIGNEIFTGETHTEALGKAVEQFGTNSPEIKTFAELGDPLNSIGLYDDKRGFIPDISGDKGKSVVETAKEAAATPEPIASRETVPSEPTAEEAPTPEPQPATIGEALDAQAREHRDLPPKPEPVAEPEKISAPNQPVETAPVQTDPLLSQEGSWRDELVPISVDGKPAEVKAGLAVDFLNARRNLVADLMECLGGA